MRFAALLVAALTTGCVMGATPTVVTQTPASITYECLGAVGGCQASPQEVADMAQRHCRTYGKNAQQAMLARAPSGNLRATFVCV